ncbi:Acyl-CoA dehydrogenase, middle domain [Actinopolyspora xinjiangensis]|uniref:Acyl-CoA dehydrogenase, middle domain n=1 Tax=Actinopolyspora xinjiangensis TaxID=405564 RepID=A0A1H0WX59_9ACTN|nr:acyl-CoA dehydrogenase family protein [Actinopolyspora xinjiangensis]SDP95291.1 Acyl-CoA dehydrogenase, middle domain [Actinopolyspora xinjiangensis]
MAVTDMTSIRTTESLVRQRIGWEQLYAVLDEHRARSDRDGRLAPEVLHALRESELPGLVVPKYYGGSGADSLEANRRVAELAYHHPSVAIIAFQHMAVCSRIAEFGTSRQRAELLPPLASGDWLAASAWSESGAGASKRNLATTATQQADGSWLVSGGKAFTTGAGLADVYLILAQTGEDVEDDLSYGSSGQSFFLVPATSEGIEPDTDMDLIGMRASATGFVRLTGCTVSPDSLLGPRDAAHRVIAEVKRSGASLGAVSVGIAEAAWDLSYETARKKNLLEHQAQRHRLAELRGRVEAARGLVERAGSRVSDEPGNTTLHSKIFASETAEEVIINLSRMLGSAGYVSDNPVNQLINDSRAVALMGPTNDLSKELVGNSWLS